MKKELKTSREILEYLKQLNCPVHYLANIDYLYDFVENEDINKEQYDILMSEKNYEDLVHEIFITKDVTIPNKIILAIKEAKEKRYSLSGMVIDWECENCFDYCFDYIVYEWLNEDPKEKKEKIYKIYAYGAKHWNEL